MTIEIDEKAERHYSFMLKASNAATKEQAQGNAMTWMALIGVLLFVAWLIHEDAWQAKLDRALSDCLTPMSDGTCAKRDPAAYR